MYELLNELVRKEWVYLLLQQVCFHFGWIQALNASWFPDLMIRGKIFALCSTEGWHHGGSSHLWISLSFISLSLHLESKVQQLWWINWNLFYNVQWTSNVSTNMSPETFTCKHTNCVPPPRCSVWVDISFNHGVMNHRWSGITPCSHREAPILLPEPRNEGMCL